jgi:hypothetical protein
MVDRLRKVRESQKMLEEGQENVKGIYVDASLHGLANDYSDMKPAKKKQNLRDPF